MADHTTQTYATSADSINEAELFGNDIQISEPEIPVAAKIADSTGLVLLAFAVLLVCASAFLLHQKRNRHKKSSKAAGERAVVELVKQRLATLFKDGTLRTETFFVNNLKGASPEIVVSTIVEQTRQFLRAPPNQTDSSCFDTLEVAEKIVIKTIVILTGPESQALAVSFREHDKVILKLRKVLESLQTLYSDLEKETKRVMQQDASANDLETLCSLRDRYTKCDQPVPPELLSFIAQLTESKRKAEAEDDADGDSGSAGPFNANAIEKQLQVLSSSTTDVMPVTDVVDDLKAKAEFMMGHGMPKEEAWRAVREEFAQKNQLILDQKNADIDFLRKTWLAAEVQKTQLQIAERSNAALHNCFQAQIDAMHDISERKLKWKQNLVDEEKAARAKEVARALMEAQREENWAVILFLLKLDVMILLVQQALMLWHVIGPGIFSFRCDQKVQSTSFVSYVLGGAFFNQARALCYVGQYTYMGVILTLAVVSYVLVSAFNKTAGFALPVAILAFPFRDHLLVLHSRVSWLIPSPASKYFMLFVINLMQGLDLSRCAFDVRAVLLYIVFPIISVGSTVVCSFMFSSDTPWGCFLSLVRMYQGDAQQILSC